MTIRAIEIGFGEAVELTQKDQQDLVEIAARICDRYKRANPNRTMWPSGIGNKWLTNPFMCDDDNPPEFDESVFQIDCTERENYDDPVPDIRAYLEEMDNRIAHRDGSCELSHDDALKALEDCYRIATGKQPEHTIY